MKLLILISATLSCMLMLMAQANAFDLTPLTGQNATQTEQSNSNFTLIDHHGGGGGFHGGHGDWGHHGGGGFHGNWGGHHGGGGFHGSWGGHHGDWDHDWHHHNYYYYNDNAWAWGLGAAAVTALMLNNNDQYYGPQYYICYARINGVLFQGSFQPGGPCYIQYGNQVISVNNFTTP